MGRDVETEGECFGSRRDKAVWAWGDETRVGSGYCDDDVDDRESIHAYETRRERRESGIVKRKGERKYEPWVS